MSIQLRSFLVDAGVELPGTLVMRHTPTEKPIRDKLRSWAAERHNMFNAYQATQLPKQERMLARAKRLVSCIGHEPGLALFVGVYEVQGYRPMTAEEYRAMPENQEMYGPDHPGADCRWFNLQLLDSLKEWKGKLAVRWPPPAVNWARWADRIFPIQAIHPESILVPPMPSRRELVLDWGQLQVLPKSWADRLSQWRGIYLIRDTTDGKCYVGSACGEQNIYGRWLNYAASGDGGNKRLRERDPSNFLVSILEVLGHDLPLDEVVALENTWKTRLHTRSTGLNVN
jgi:GIY-YIG catalytic domain-containing protein